MKEMLNRLFNRKGAEKKYQAGVDSMSTHRTVDTRVQTREQIINSITVRESAGRTIMTIPTSLFVSKTSIQLWKIRDLITRDLYMKISGGSTPAWSNTAGDSCQVEVPTNHATPLKEAIADWILSNE